MKTFEQILREFWLPFLIALAWTAFRADFSRFHVAEAIPTFAASFFLASWASGQFVRVRKQQRIETSFADVISRIESVASRLEDSAVKIVSSVTGGDSYCRFVFNAGLAQNVLVLNEGEHPLYAVQARIVDLTVFGSLDTNSQTFPFAADAYITIGDIPPGMGKEVSLKLTNPDWTGLNVFFSARNGNWLQRLRRETPVSGVASRVNWSGEENIQFDEVPLGVDEHKFEHGW